MTVLQWVVLGLAVLSVLGSAKYVILPTLRELHQREQEETGPIEVARAELCRLPVFHSEDLSYPQFGDDLRQAQEIICIGTTLAALPAQFGEFLERWIQTGETTRLQCFLLHPDWARKNPVILRQALERVVGGRQVKEEEFLERLERSVEFFKHLGELAPGKVELWGVMGLTPVGVTIIDPQKRRSRMRVTPYVLDPQKERDPVFIVSRNGDRAEEKVYNWFYGHYQAVTRISERVPRE